MTYDDRYDDRQRGAQGHARDDRYDDGYDDDEYDEADDEYPDPMQRSTHVGDAETHKIITTQRCCGSDCSKWIGSSWCVRVSRSSAWAHCAMH